MKRDFSPVKKMSYVSIVARNLEEAPDAYSRGFEIEIETRVEVSDA